MSRISDYTESEVRRRQENFGINVVDYNRTDYGDGLTIVQYRITISKKMHVLGAICTFGVATVGTAAADVILRNQVTALYFDTETGFLLGSTKREAAIDSNNRGLQCVREYRFDIAVDWFRKAFRWVEDQSNSHPYKNNIDVTVIAIQAERFFSNREYLSSCQKFKEAYDIATSVEIYGVLAQRMRMCEEAANPQERPIVQSIINMSGIAIGGNFNQDIRQ